MTLDTMFEEYNQNLKQIGRQITRQCSNRMEDKLEKQCKQNAHNF